MQLIVHDREIFEQSRRRDLDLADAVMFNWHEATRRFYGCISIHRKNWDVWTEKHLKGIEERIAADFAFDGYTTIIQRFRGLGQPCTEEAIWAVDVAVDYGEEDGSEGP